MPIRLDTHNPDIDLTPGTPRSDIVAFLYDNPEYGYNPTELSERLDIPHGIVATTLTRLHEAGYVGKTGGNYYRALDHHESLRRYVASLTQLERMFSHPPGERPQGEGNPESEPIDEDALNAELAELEAELEQSD